MPYANTFQYLFTFTNRLSERRALVYNYNYYGDAGPFWACTKLLCATTRNANVLNEKNKKQRKTNQFAKLHKGLSMPEIGIHMRKDVDLIRNIYELWPLPC